MFASLAKHGRIFLVELKNNWVREVIYRSNFITAALVDLVWIIVEATLFNVLYSHVQTVAGWTLHQTYFFLGVFFASDALFTLFFSRNFWTFTDYVAKGEFDILLIKPANALFLATTRAMNLTAGFNVILGFIIMFRFGHQAGFAGGVAWLHVFGWLLIGLMSQFLLRLFFMVWVFWTDRGFSLALMYYKLFELATKPDLLYPYMVRFIILTIIPFGFIGSVPARAILQGLTPGEYFRVFGVLVALALVNMRLWKRGMLRYQSASS